MAASKGNQSSATAGGIDPPQPSPTSSKGSFADFQLPPVDVVERIRQPIAVKQRDDPRGFRYDWSTCYRNSLFIMLLCCDRFMAWVKHCHIASVDKGKKEQLLATDFSSVMTEFDSFWDDYWSGRAYSKGLGKLWNKWFLNSTEDRWQHKGEDDPAELFHHMLDAFNIQLDKNGLIRDIQSLKTALCPVWTLRVTCCACPLEEAVKIRTKRGDEAQHLMEVDFPESKKDPSLRLETLLQSMVKCSMTGYECNACEKNAKAQLTNLVSKPEELAIFQEERKQRKDAGSRSWNYLRYLPEVLIMRLRRSRESSKTSEGIPIYDKDERFVSFSEEMDLSSLLDPKVVHEEQRRHTRYRLVGVVSHAGNKNSGHYINFTRSEEGQWYRIDGEHVEPLGSFHQVNEAYYYITGRRHNENRQLFTAYMLCWEKIIEDDKEEPNAERVAHSAGPEAPSEEVVDKEANDSLAEKETRPVSPKATSEKSNEIQAKSASPTKATQSIVLEVAQKSPEQQPSNTSSPTNSTHSTDSQASNKRPNPRDLRPPPPPRILTDYEWQYARTILRKLPIDPEEDILKSLNIELSPNADADVDLNQSDLSEAAQVKLLEYAKENDPERHAWGHLHLRINVNGRLEEYQIPVPFGIPNFLERTHGRGSPIQFSLEEWGLVVSNPYIAGPNEAYYRFPIDRPRGEITRLIETKVATSVKDHAEGWMGRGEELRAEKGVEEPASTLSKTAKPPSHAPSNQSPSAGKPAATAEPQARPPAKAKTQTTSKPKVASKPKQTQKPKATAKKTTARKKPAEPSAPPRATRKRKAEDDPPAAVESEEDESPPGPKRRNIGKGVSKPSAPARATRKRKAEDEPPAAVESEEDESPRGPKRRNIGKGVSKPATPPPEPETDSSQSPIGPGRRNLRNRSVAPPPATAPTKKPPTRPLTKAERQAAAREKRKAELDEKFAHQRAEAAAQLEKEKAAAKKAKIEIDERNKKIQDALKKMPRIPKRKDAAPVDKKKADTAAVDNKKKNDAAAAALDGGKDKKKPQQGTKRKASEEGEIVDRRTKRQKGGRPSNLPKGMRDDMMPKSDDSDDDRPLREVRRKRGGRRQTMRWSS